MELIGCLAIICLIPLLIVLFSKWRYTYWTRKGVFQLEPEFFYGNLRELLTAKRSMGEVFRSIYFTLKNKKQPFGGIYWMFRPTFIVIDTALIKDMLLKNFTHFEDRGGYNHKNDVLTQQLFTMEGEAWKQLRAKLSPTFTSSKLKMMFDTLQEKAVNLKKVIDQSVEAGGKMNVTDISGRFTTDVIGSCAFGIECDSLHDPDCEFRFYGKKINAPNKLKMLLINTIPASVLYYTGFKSFPEVEKFFRKLVGQTIEHREKNKIFRKDFLHLLIQLRNRGILTDDGQISRNANEKGIITDDEIVAQCFLFFGAGFDTSSATISFLLYELAKHPDIQDRVRGEINEVLNKNGGKLTYDAVKELIFTQQVISETLRLYPILPSVPRICTKRYKIPGTNITLEKGTLVQIPLWGIHKDPEFYKNPEQFDPERFSAEEKAKRPDYTYFPFGEGPRICIGARFAMLQITTALTELLRNNRYSLLPETPEIMTFKASMPLLHSEEDIMLHVDKI